MGASLKLRRQSQDQPDMDDKTKGRIIETLTELIVDLAPDANLRPMYGGTVI